MHLLKLVYFSRNDIKPSDFTSEMNNYCYLSEILPGKTGFCLFYDVSKAIVLDVYILFLSYGGW